MSGAIKVLEGGTVTSPQGFLAGATYAGLKTYAEDKLDLALKNANTECPLCHQPLQSAHSH